MEGGNPTLKVSNSNVNGGNSTLKLDNSNMNGGNFTAYSDEYTPDSGKFKTDSGNLIRLSSWVFIAVFAKNGYHEIHKNIKGTLKKQLEEQKEYDNLFESGKPLSLTLKQFLKDNAQDILKTLPVIGEIIAGSLIAG